MQSLLKISKKKFKYQKGAKENSPFEKGGIKFKV